MTTNKYSHLQDGAWTATQTGVKRTLHQQETGSILPVIMLGILILAVALVAAAAYTM